jgi:hypothetical protein
MRVHHRIPSIFNLSMVDVLCCALGCVILLWLINLREARQRTDQAGLVQKELDAARAELAELGRQATGLRAGLADATRRADAALAQYEAASALMTSTQAELRDVRAGRDRLRDELTGAARRIAALEIQVRDREALAGVHARRALELSKQLADAESRSRELRAAAVMVPDLQDEAKSYRAQLRAEQDKIVAAEARYQSLDRQLTDANRARAAAENRFAGLALTGRRVVFLVDMSGSMDLVDENTPAPGKWQSVRDTLAHVMRSLPDLEKFQVIVFAEKSRYLLGQDDRWIDFDGKPSIERVARSLAVLQPKGGTNMYSAFEMAFHLRASGMDTMYLFSDGLPNLGEGLSPEAARTLKEPEQNEILGRHIRRMLKASWNRDRPGQPRVRINAIGFFFESPDVGAFLWALTRENDGGFVGMSKP